MADGAIVHGRKSWVETFVERAGLAVQKAPASSPLSYVRAAGGAAMTYGLAGGLGAVLGATHARFGLDTRWGPIDGWLSAAGAIAGIALSGTSPTWAAGAMQSGAMAFNILTFRKSFELVRGEPFGGHRVSHVPEQSVAHGEDPILKKAEALG